MMTRGLMLILLVLPSLATAKDELIPTKRKTRDRQQKQQNPLYGVADDMDAVARLIRVEKTADTTQDRQKGIIDKLDKLIEMARQQSQQPPKSDQNQKKKQRQQQQRPQPKPAQQKKKQQEKKKAAEQQQQNMQLEQAKIEVHYLGYYLKWTPQESYYYAVENTAFQARPFRTQGTYSKYNSIDDKIDDLHYYTTHIKFGLGRASYDASQEIRNKHITRDEGVALVHRFDGEFPDRYFNEVLAYLDMDGDGFHALCDRFRSPHLWKKENGEWMLRERVA